MKIGVTWVPDTCGAHRDHCDRQVRTVNVLSDGLIDTSYVPSKRLPRFSISGRHARSLGIQDIGSVCWDSDTGFRPWCSLRASGIS